MKSIWIKKTLFKNLKVSQAIKLTTYPYEISHISRLMGHYQERICIDYQFGIG